MLLTTKVRALLTFAGRKELVTGKGHEGTFQDAGDTLFLDLGSSSTIICFMIKY